MGRKGSRRRKGRPSKRNKTLHPLDHPARKKNKKVCRGCGGLLHGRQTSWCGAECSDRRLACTRDFRKLVWLQSDRHCELCSLDIIQAVRDRWIAQGVTRNRRVTLRATHGIWEADHTIPKIEGGSWGPENGRVLCVECHKEETRALTARRVAARRMEQ